MADLVKLKTFLYAAENMSFSEAAKHLHLTEPTISHHIKTLEREMGVELFIRSGSTLKLTEAGRLLMPWARKLIHQSIEMEAMMAALQQQKIVGHLRLACSTTAGKYILPLLAARFRQRHPGVRVSILTCTSGHVTSHLLKEEANLGIVSYEVRDNELECQRFFEDAIILIVPANHPWAARSYIEPDELVGEPLIIREPTSGTHQVMLTELARHDITLDDLNIFLELGNAEATVNTVAAGYGVSFVSNLAIACSLKQGQVVEVPVRGLDLRRTIYMVQRSLEPPSRPQEVFWSFIHHPSNADLLQLAKAH
jgi:DNA-binding transcriptional LysR family regulator